MLSAVLFDFFGTLVEYQPDRSQLGSPRTHGLAQSYGFVGDHDAFVGAWDQASSLLERAATTMFREFSMTDAATAFADASGLRIDAVQAEALGSSFVVEWAQHIQPVVGAAELVERLAERWSIAIVSNTHDPNMVPDMLDDMGISTSVSTVALSIDHGRPKPHPSIYAAALEALACPAHLGVFVGDSYDADYIGPIDAGMRAFLIDPSCRHSIPAEHRLADVLDIERALGLDAS